MPYKQTGFAAGAATDVVASISAAGRIVSNVAASCRPKLTRRVTNRGRSQSSRATSTWFREGHATLRRTLPGAAPVATCRRYVVIQGGIDALVMLQKPRAGVQDDRPLHGGSRTPEPTPTAPSR